MPQSVSTAPPPTPDWGGLWQRMKTLFWLKLLGVSAFMWVFFLAYFQTLRHPQYPVFVMPLTWVDSWVQFQPWSLVAYLSLWLYVGIPAGLMPGLRALLAYGAWAALMCIVGLAIFHFFPSAVPRSAVVIDLAQHPGFALLQGVDAAGNACPSLHVAGAVFSALWIERLFRQLGLPAWLRGLNLLWGLLIVYSTLATRQHVFLDAAAGAVMGAVFAGLSMRWFARESAQPFVAQGAR